MTQEERERSMPTFTDAMTTLMGIATPAEVAKQEEHQLQILATRLPDSGGTQLVSISNIIESPTNPRHRFGDLDDLIASIRKGGLLQAPVGRLMSNGKIQIVVGARRFRASKHAGLEEIRVDVREMSDHQVLEAQAIENLHREELHPMEEAEHYGRMREAGYTGATIGEKIGKQKTWVLSRLKLLALGPEARSSFYEGHIHVSVAVPLARIPGGDNQAKALQMISKPGLKVADQIEILQKEFCQNLKGAPFDLKDETLVPEERNEKTKELLYGGACARCPQNANNQPVQLFGDFTGGIEKQGVCLMTSCFAMKARAAFARQAEKAKDRGAKVLSAADTAKLINRNGQLAYQAPVVLVDAVIDVDVPKKRTWAQLFDKLEDADMPAQMVGPDVARPGKMVKFFDRKEAMAAARKLGMKWAAGAAVAAAAKKDELSDEDKQERKEARAKEKAAKEKQEAVLLVTKMTIPSLVKTRWSSKAGLPEMRVLAAELFAKRSSTRKSFEPEDQEAQFSGFDMPGAREGKGGRIPTERAIETWIEKHATEKELIAFCMVLVCYDKWTDTNDDFEATFADLAFAAGADLKKGVRAQLDIAAAEAEKKKSNQKGG